MPSVATLKAIAVAVALAAVFFAGWTAQGWKMGREAEAVKAQANADALRSANKAIDETGRRLAAQEAADREQAERDTRERDAAAAIAADRDRLRGAVADLQRRAAHSSAAGQRAATAALGAVFDACVARYAELERDATDDRSRGLACEQRYDALTKRSTPP